MRNNKKVSSYIKRSSLVIFVLLGLVVLEYGCKKEEPAKTCEDTVVYKVTDINTVWLLEESDSQVLNLEQGDSVLYSNLVANASFNMTTVMNLPKSGSNYGAYALIFAPEPLCWNTNSIHIQGITSTETIDLTNLFTVSKLYTGSGPFDITNDKAFRQKLKVELAFSPTSLQFEMKSPPAKAESLQLRFVFGNEDGSSYEFTTETITILP